MASAPVYAALLRGINVGGKHMVSMKALKTRLEREGFENVVTYINSGNIILRAAGTDARSLESTFDRIMSTDFGVPGRTVVRTKAEMTKVVSVCGRTWKVDPAWRYNVCFLRHTLDSPKVLEGIELDADVERVSYCPGVLLWSVRADAGPRTTMMKLLGKPAFQDLTVRNLNTTRKVLELMEN